MSRKRAVARALAPAFDLVAAGLVAPAAGLMKFMRGVGYHKFPYSRSVLMRIGVFPIRNHYYEPRFDNRDVREAFAKERDLNGLDLGVEGQLETLRLFSRADELAGTPLEKRSDTEFYLNNGTFESGDAEYWYQLLRHLKPRRVYEVGSGNSTLMAIRALERNRAEDAGYTCEHVCIEPYEMPWLERCEVEVVRRRVEEVGMEFFGQLERNDVLFIDSSHVIRPQGDVLYEYLTVLPTLREGVVVHVHDVFTPRDYPAEWMVDEVRLWNEQYLLEAFLTQNPMWKVLGALNHLRHHHYDELKRVTPFLRPDREPGSFYIQRVA